ncbi:MAG: hypothetical protein U0271_38515 [Polyangiaceae bacterium]
MSAIPRRLTRAHVDAAIVRINHEGVPPRRESTKFHLLVGGRRYPPKYVLSLAVAEATGRELSPTEFSGGDETNTVLESLGFTVVSANTRVGTTIPIARVVVRGAPPPSPRAAGELLLEAFEKWPVEGTAKFTITPGGFVCGNFPSRWSGGLGWHSSEKDLVALERAATPVIHECVNKRVLAAAAVRTRALTIGVDLSSAAQHAELVAVIDCKSGKIVRWTGKSYPTGDQEGLLVQVADLRSHLLEFAGERVLLLGCHDLNMFSARARANQSPEGFRRQRCDAMARLTARFKPTIVLQHPHSTDTPNIWRMPWACVERDYPTVRAYASGVAYLSTNAKPRRPLHAVLSATRSETGVVDIVVKSR